MCRRFDPAPHHEVKSQSPVNEMFTGDFISWGTEFLEISSVRPPCNFRTHCPITILDLPDDMDMEKRRAIGVMVEKFHCPVMRFRKVETAKPATARSRDTVVHHL